VNSTYASDSIAASAFDINSYIFAFTIKLRFSSIV